MKIKELAKNMFLPESEHVRRLELLGKNLSEKTLNQKRQLLGKIVETFGEEELESVFIKDVVQHLLGMKEERSSSWKNRYLEVFKNLYDEYNWRMENSLPLPAFPRFSNSPRQADVFSSDELKRLFDKKIWRNEDEFLLFYITVSCGLRLGEARGLRANQFLFDRHILLVDGFMRYDGTRTLFNKSGSLREKKQRVVFLPQDVEEEAKAYLKKKNLSGDDFLFVINGKPVSQEFCERVFKRMLKKACIEKNGR
ncbi:MAG: site-specific integrase, partial [Treponema sp.]|nr:site-specific integrase [Treponema sp.]